MIEFNPNLSIIIKLILLINTIDGKYMDENFNRESDALPIRRTKRLIVYDGQDAEINDYPWMAMLLYDKKRVTKCAGSLLNQRYILTAAHCVVDNADKSKLTAVRLGEYNRATYPDCGPLNGKIVCGRLSFDIPVDRVIPHENYDPDDLGDHHDIALIRLARKVDYNHHTRPIHLPTSSYRPKSFWVAGWGHDKTSHPAAIKQKLEVPYFNWSKCSRLYKTISIPLYHSQICAGNFKKKSVCPGDSGGPLMSKKYISKSRRQWIIHGIVSHGRHSCGTKGSKGWPSIFTKVYDYVPWIMKKIKKYDPWIRVP